jgi:hypothetical protein
LYAQCDQGKSEFVWYRSSTAEWLS